jgi:hypothetical protein
MLDILDQMGSNVYAKKGGAESIVMVSCQSWAAFAFAARLSDRMDCFSL